MGPDIIHKATLRVRTLKVYLQYTEACTNRVQYTPIVYLQYAQNNTKSIMYTKVLFTVCVQLPPPRVQ